MDKKQVTGLTREEKELLDSYNRMIMQRGWLNGSDNSNAQTKLKNGFKDALGLKGEGHYYNYMLLLKKDKEARMYNKKAAENETQKTVSDEASKYFETLKIPDYDKAYDKAYNQANGKSNDIKQVADEAAYKTKQLKDAAQVILNWDTKYKRLFEENVEPDFYDETVDRMNTDAENFNLTTDRLIFTKNPNDMPVYVGFDNDLKNIRYEYFEKDLENAKGITGISSSVLGEMDPDKRLKIRDGMALYVKEAADAFIKAVDNNVYETKEVKGKKVEVKKELTMNEERELILKGLDILCHPAFSHTDLDNPPAGLNYALKNEVFQRLRKLTGDRANDLESRYTAPEIKGPDGIEKAYKFIYSKAGYEGVAYYQWVTSLNSSLDVLVARNKLDRMEAHLEVGNHYRKALNNYYDDKADINYASLSDFDAETKKLKELEASVAELEKEYQKDYVGISEGKEKPYGYNEKVKEWNETDKKLNRELNDLRRKRMALLQMEANITADIKSAMMDISIRTKDLDALRAKEAAEEENVRKDVEQAELDLNTFKNNVSAELKKMEDANHEKVIENINAWTKENGIALSEEDINELPHYNELVEIKKKLDERRVEIGKVTGVQNAFYSDINEVFGSATREEIVADKEKMTNTEKEYSEFSNVLFDANMANRTLCDFLVFLTKNTSLYEEAKDEAENTKVQIKNTIDILAKAYSKETIVGIATKYGDDEKALKERYNEKYKNYDRSEKNTVIAEYDRVYNTKDLKGLIDKAKTGPQLITAINAVLNRGEKYRKRLETSCSALTDKIAAENAALSNKVNGDILPSDITKGIPAQDAKKYYDKVKKSYDIVEESVLKAREEEKKAQEEHDKLYEEFTSYKNKFDDQKANEIIPLIENAEDRLDNIKGEIEGKEAQFNTLKAWLENAEKLCVYADAKDRYNAITMDFNRNVDMNKKINDHRTPETLKVIVDANKTEKEVAALLKDYENYETEFRSQLTDLAQRRYLESLSNIEKTVNSQAQEVMTAAVDNILEKDESGETIGQQIHRTSVEIDGLKKAVEKFNSNHDRVTKEILEVEKQYKAAEENLIKTTKANEAEQKRLEKLCDNYVKQRALLFNKQGIMKNELPRMQEYFSNANEQYGKFRSLLSLTDKDSEAIKDKNVQLESLANGRPTNEFRSSVEKELLGYFTAANLKQFKTSNSDDFTKMVNAIGNAIGRDPIDNSGKSIAADDREKTNFFANGSLKDCRKRLEEIKLAAEKYIDAKKNQKWILFPSELRIHRLSNAISLVNYVESCLDQLTGNKKDYKVEAAPKANDAQKSDKSIDVQPAQSSVTVNKNGLLKRYEDLQNNFRTLITIPHTQGNVFEDYEAKVDELRIGTNVKSSNNEMQAFITTGLHRLNMERTVNEDEAGISKENHTLSKTKMHIYVDSKASAQILKEETKQEKGLISSLFSAVKDKVTSFFK